MKALRLLTFVVPLIFVAGISIYTVESHAATAKQTDVPNSYRAVVHVPPSNFDPLKATDAELSYYNIPPRPKDPNELKKWIKIVSHNKMIKPEFGTPIPHPHPEFRGSVTK